MNKRPTYFIRACLALFLGLLSFACSNNNSSPAPSVQEIAFENANESQTASPNNSRLDCSSSGEFTFPVVENPDRRKVGEPLTPKDMEIRVGKDVLAKIELPVPDSEAKNFSLVSTNKSKEGFVTFAKWGGGKWYYEIQFNFRCTDKKFYLYKVIHNDFSTTDPDSGNFLDKKETKEIKVEPNLPIEKFVMLDHLNS